MPGRTLQAALHAVFRLGMLPVWLASACTGSSPGSGPPTARQTIPPSSVTLLADWTWPTTEASAQETGTRVAEALRTHGGRPVLLHDDGMWVVVLDTDADLDVVRRTPSSGHGPRGETFTRAAAGADITGQVDVVVNGMTYSFDPTVHMQGSKQATHGQAHGQALQSGAVVGGQPLRPTTARYHLVQHSETGGQGTGDWSIAPGNASEGTGLSGPMAILADGAPIGQPGGPQNADTDKLLRLPRGTHMPYVGLDATRSLVWVLVKTAGSTQQSEVTRVDDVRRVLGWLGVRDAVAMDGGVSATLVVDGHVLVRPSPIADRSIPFGLRLSWRPDTDGQTAP